VAAGADRSRPIMRTAFALLSVQGLTWAASLVGVLVVPRYLGAERLGVFATAGTVAGVVGIIAAFGTSNQLVKAVARDPSQTANLVVHAVAARLAVWAVFLALTLAVVLTFVDDPVARFVVLMTLVAALFGLVAGAAVAGLQGRQSLGQAAAAGSVIGLAAQAVVVATLVAGGGIVALTNVGVGAAAVSAVVTVALFWRRLSGRIEPSSRLAGRILLAGAPFLAWELGLQVYGTIDYLLLAALTDVRTVGAYAFAYRLASIPIFVTTVVTGAVYPALSTAAVSDRAYFRALVRDATRVVILLTIPMSVGLIVLAPDVARVIGGGRQFDNAVPLVAVLSLHIPVAGLDTVLGTALFALDRQRRLAAVAWVAAAINPLFNLAAIPLAVRWFDNGAIGAAVITVATECFMGVCVWIMLAEDLPHRRIASIAAQTLFATMIMAFAVRVALTVAGLGGAVITGGIVYSVCAFAMRLVTPQDARALRSAFAHR
jgi:O-antigen/teichoic acid export membrane protein